MTEAELQRLEALANNATPGPWELERCGGEVVEHRAAALGGLAREELGNEVVHWALAAD